MSALWGASFPLIRIASPALGPFGVAGLRCLLAALVLSGLLRLLRHEWPRRASWPGLVLLGFMTVAMPFVLYNYAALVLPAGYSAVLNATAPLFGVLATAAIGEERLTVRRLLGCALGFAGVVLLVQLGPVSISTPVLLAALACTLASACYGIGSIWMKRASQAHQPLSVAAVVHVGAAGALLVPMGASVPSMQPTVGIVVSIVFLGCITSGLMYWLSLRLMREISATAATSSAFMIPLFGVTWGGLFLGEPITWGMLPGCLLVLAATALITGFNPFKAAPPEP